MIVYKNGNLLQDFSPCYAGKNIVIAIDSSKSNSAMVVGLPDGTVLDDFEISGAGSNVDVYDLCKDTRAFLKEIFKGSYIRFVGIEDIITKKEKAYKGIDIHTSRAKITAVFNNFIFAFEEYYGIRPVPINNWTWKSNVLPEKYRKKDHDKGSKDYFNDLGNRWAGRKDDVTDAVCIFIYIIKLVPIKVKGELLVITPPRYQYEYALFPETFPMADSAKEFDVRVKGDLEQIAASISNNIDSKQFGYFFANIEEIPLSMIYSDKLCSNNVNKYGRVTDRVIVAVRRKDS